MTSQLLEEHRDRLRDRITELGLRDFKTGILNGSYSSYLLVGAKQDASQEFGTSRFGGEPDIPQSFDAARLDELVFVCQVNMSDLPQAQDLGLPDAGILAIFSDPHAEYGKTFFFEKIVEIRASMRIIIHIFHVPSYA